MTGVAFRVESYIEYTILGSDTVLTLLIKTLLISYTFCDKKTDGERMITIKNKKAKDYKR